MIRKFAVGLAAMSVLALYAAPASAKVGPEIFKAKNCTQCHSVSAYGIKGGAMGPDLSIAATDVKKRHNKDLEKFFADPDGIMKGLFASANLTPDEKKGMIKLLKDAPKAKK